MWRKGDAVLIPAGAAYMMLDDLDSRFQTWVAIRKIVSNRICVTGEKGRRKKRKE
jgi:hypothetical protein